MEPKTCQKGPKLGFEYWPTSKTLHCVRTACMAFPMFFLHAMTRGLGSIVFDLFIVVHCCRVRVEMEAVTPRAVPPPFRNCDGPRASDGPSLRTCPAPTPCTTTASSWVGRPAPHPLHHHGRFLGRPPSPHPMHQHCRFLGRSPSPHPMHHHRQFLGRIGRILVYRAKQGPEDLFLDDGSTVAQFLSYANPPPPPKLGDIFKQIGATNRGTTLSRFSAHWLATQLPTDLDLCPHPQKHLSFGCCTVRVTWKPTSPDFQKKSSPSGFVHSP